MKTTIITTVNHNIGDDFVREGIIYLLSCLLPSLDRSTISLVHKHSPITTFNGFSNFRNLRLSRFLSPLLRQVNASNSVSETQLLIQSGAPIYWCHENGKHCSNNEWYIPLVRELFERRKYKSPFLNIAGGSCQTYHSDGLEFKNCPKCMAYVRELFDICDLTILRDNLARKILNTVDRDARVLPCTSIFARDSLGINPQPGKYVVLNFMENGGHFTFGQSIDKEAWQTCFRNIANHASKCGNIIIACHNKKELDLCNLYFPDLRTYLVPNNYRDYMNFYSEARFGIVNRVHAGFMLASLGKPAIVIGNDSRALMIKNLNLSSYYVNDTPSPEALLTELELRENSYANEIESIRDHAKQIYLEELANVI